MLYIFTKSEIGAGGSRHRAFFVANFLKKNGHELKLIIPPIYRKETPRMQARFEYLKTIFSLRKSDTVLLQNPIFSKYFILCICIVKVIFRPTLVFDFDDATWVQNPIAPRVMAFFSDKYIVASHYLANWKNIQGKPIMVMPNLVDYELAMKYRVARSDKKIVLGWIGGAPLSLHNLKILVPVFEKLVSDGVSFKFLLIGTLGSDEVVKTFSLRGMDFEFVDRLDWGKEGEIQKANSRFDIGLCPLVDNESNRGRCSLKVLDYMASSIPVIASPIGENEYFIENNVTGYLPSSTEDWVESIKKLISDDVLRDKMGKSSFNKLVKEYSYQSNIDKYISFLGLKS
jgi:glycosyltransferase involved in cell wall biosynthesis